MTQELRKLAEAATQGPWIAAGPSYGDPVPRYYNTVVTDTDYPIEDEDICSDTMTSEDALYIAAANPAAILALLDRLENAEKDAERYRWLRNGPLVDGEICEELYVAVDSTAWPGKWALVGSDLDKAVDAMEASK